MRRNCTFEQFLRTGGWQTTKEAISMKISPLLLHVRRFVGVVIATLVISLAPVPAVFADSVTSCTPPSPSSPGVHVPTGSDAGMYHYDCDQQLWVSSHYSYNPKTDTTTPLDITTYTYNNVSGQWDYDTWVYVASKGDYALRTFSVSIPPVGAATVGGPVMATPGMSESSAGAGSQSPDGSALAIADTSNGTATAIAVANTIGSIATTGDASVVANTSAGSAASGSASAMATLVNMLQSTGNVFGSAGNAVVFNTTINGDVTGDILLDPSLISAIQPSAAVASSLADGGTLARSTTDMSVTNNLTVGAASGNALVDANTEAGDANSGSATAVANVLNFLNSTIVSGKSFIGVINIDGNLNGDILLPPNFIDELLASNVPTLSIAAPLGSNGSLDTSVSQSINNAVATAAQTGNAVVDKNTNAGNATSGNATTNITTFNLTGNSVIGKNALLVFVNVLGSWYGLIFNAPGATAASLGGNITSASAVGPGNIGQFDTNQTINNNIIATATTGDATVTRNTNAGSAKTGDAKVAVNILNIAQSALSLSDWFGILFINVFGTWTGSFGIDTIAGTVTPPTNAPTANNTANQNSTVFKFVPKTVSTLFTRTASPSSDQNPTDLSSGSVLAAQHTGAPANKIQGQKQKSLYWMYATFLGIWVVLIAAERIYSKMRSAH